MACGATLKRSLEFLEASPAQRPHKRRRCVPMTMSPTAAPTKVHQTAPSPFGDVTPKLSTEEIASSIAQEIKRMRKRKQLYDQSSQESSDASAGPSSPYASPCSSPPRGDMGELSVQISPAAKYKGLCGPPSPTRVDKPVFTCKQVSLVCERMLKEREAEIRQEYDRVLSTKLAEQYEAFLKFNHDQMQRRMHEQPASYYS